MPFTPLTWDTLKLTFDSTRVTWDATRQTVAGLLGGHFGFDEKKRKKRWDAERLSEEERRKALIAAFRGLDEETKPAAVAAIAGQQAERIEWAPIAADPHRFDAVMAMIDRMAEIEQDDEEILGLMLMGAI